MAKAKTLVGLDVHGGQAAIVAREHAVDIGSELGPQHLLDLQPRDLRGVVLHAGLRILPLHPNQVAATRVRFRVSGG